MGWREGLVSRPDWTAGGRASRKALREFMVRGMPLKEMHLRPTSRISSAAWTGDAEDGEDGDEARAWRWVREEGELSVNVAAAYLVPFPIGSC